jgi:uroporphyrinogen decarboxylase
MNSKERVIAALERRTLDRVPLDLVCGGPNSAHEDLCRYFKVSNDDQLRSKLNIDIRGVGPRYVGPVDRAPGGNLGLATEFGGTEYMKCDYARSGGIAGTYSDIVGLRPLQKCTSLKDIEDYPWPDIEWFDFSNIRTDCNKHQKYAIMFGGWTPLLSRVFELFGMKTALINLHTRPDLIHAVIKKTTDFYYEVFDIALSNAEGGIDIAGFGDDFATQEDLMISPNIWRSFIKEPLSRLFSLGQKHNVYIFFHSCGAVRRIIPDLIEIGLDILFPIQPRATGMDPAELKEEFGDRLAFWGGVDVQRTLPFGTTEEVRREVRERIRILGAGGGYILSSSHNLEKHFPLQNILAMYDEAMKVSLISQ